jgi:general secretion pathway protein G
MKRKHARGFTLVEILIVVIILGILAAIVIPQFTNASNNARTSSVQSTLQSIRSQIELYKIQHNDTPPALTDGVVNWGYLTGWTNTTGTTTASANSTNYPFGPYLQQVPTNPILGLTGISSAATDTANGWYYSLTTAGNIYTVEPRNTSGSSISTY